VQVLLSELFVCCRQIYVRACWSLDAADSDIWLQYYSLPSVPATHAITYCRTLRPLLSAHWHAQCAAFTRHLEWYQTTLQSFWKQTRLMV